MIEEDLSIARPYAEAVYALAQETNTLDVWSAELTVLSQIVAEKSIQSVLKDPAIEGSQHLALIQSIVGDTLTQPLSAFLSTLVENERLLQLPAIAHLFNKLKQAASGQMEVEVTSAYVLKPAEKKQLEVALSKKFAQDISIVSTKNHDLIGGVKIKANDFVIDGSIKGQLTQLANQLGI